MQVSEYVRERILALREQSSPQYRNIACLRTNAQKYLVHYFRKGQLTKLFFLFPVRNPCPQRSACIGRHYRGSPGCCTACKTAPALNRGKILRHPLQRQMEALQEVC